MPIYEYRCNDCSHTFQLFQSVGSRGEGVTCPKCSSDRIEPLLSAFASAPSGGSISRAGCGPVST